MMFVTMEEFTTGLQKVIESTVKATNQATRLNRVLRCLHRTCHGHPKYRIPDHRKAWADRRRARRHELIAHNIDYKVKREKKAFGIFWDIDGGPRDTYILKSVRLMRKTKQANGMD